MTTTDPLEPPAPAGRSIRVILLGVMLAMLLSMLDYAIVGTAMPTVVSDLGGLEHIARVVTAYTLLTAISTPVWGRLGDLFSGHRGTGPGGDLGGDPPAYVPQRQLRARLGAVAGQRRGDVRRGALPAAVPADRAGRVRLVLGAVLLPMTVPVLVPAQVVGKVMSGTGRYKIFPILGGPLGVALFGALFTRALDGRTAADCPTYLDAVALGTGQVLMSVAAVTAVWTVLSWLIDEVPLRSGPPKTAPATVPATAAPTRPGSVTQAALPVRRHSS